MNKLNELKEVIYKHLIRIIFLSILITFFFIILLFVLSSVLSNFLVNSSNIVFSRLSTKTFTSFISILSTKTALTAFNSTLTSSLIFSKAFIVSSKESKVSIYFIKINIIYICILLRDKSFLTLLNRSRFCVSTFDCNLST